MEDDERYRSGPLAGAVMLAFIGGAVLGGVCALLVAPQSGEQSRGQLRRYARKTSDNLRDLAGKAEETWGAAVEKGRQFVQEQKTTLTDAMEAGQQAMRGEYERHTGEKKNQ